MDVVRNFKSMTAVQFCGLQIFEFSYVAALAFFPFFVASHKFVYAILVLLGVAGIAFIFKRHTLRVVSPVGKTVVITSCDSGLGKVCAHRLVSCGFTVIAGCHDTNSDGARALKESDAQNLHIVKLDIRDEENVQQVMLQMKALCRDKGLWALVNNADMSVYGDGEHLPLDTDKNKVSVNLTGALRITKACLPLIKTAKGRVIMMTGSTVQVPGQPAVIASNNGFEALSDSLRLELQPFGVKVITIKPGSLSETIGLFNILQLLHLTRSTASRNNTMMDAIEKAVGRQTPKRQVLVYGGS